jgi:hypothetical protein
LGLCFCGGWEDVFAASLKDGGFLVEERCIL